MEATAPAAGDRLNFFAQVGQREKRSFMLRRADVTVGLLAAVDRFVLREVQTETVLRPPVEAFTPAGRTRPLELPFHTAHTYQIMPYEEEGKGEWVDVGGVEEVSDRKRVCVEGRDVLVLRVPGGLARSGSSTSNASSSSVQYCALDSVCYHFGGPLSEGDIEDIQGRQCIVCPWHRYYIDVHTGEGILKKGLDGPCSKGKKQRTHEVKVERGRVLVKLDQSPDELASDHYAHMGLWRYPTDKTPPKVHSKRTNN